MHKMSRANVFLRIFRKNAHAELITMYQQDLSDARWEFIMVRSSIIPATRSLRVADPGGYS